MTARRHHFIPQCYLKAFAVARKAGKFQVHVFDCQTGKTFHTAIENVGLERDFNRIYVKGHPVDAVEVGLAKFESKLAPALERTITAATFVNNEDRDLIFNLIASLGLRNPRWRESVRQFHEETTKSLMDLALESEERWESQMRSAKAKGRAPSGSEITYQEQKTFHEEGNYNIELDAGYNLRMEMDMLNQVLPLLARRHWMFLKAPANSGGFVTSDHPVCLMWSEPQKMGRFYSPGFGLPRTEVLFPLSTRLALVGAFEIADGTHEVDEEMVATTNGMLTSFATRQVYARDLHFRYRPEPTREARKASRLIDEPLFRRRDPEDLEREQE